MESRTADYKMTFAYIKGKYRGAVNRSLSDPTCGDYDFKNEYTVVATKARLINDEWVVTAFRGFDVETASGGSCLPANERASMKGVRG